ncbi:hypothetical protein AR457_14005 [Streptomyces agglomeratus]|uniref:MarR family winged helix-turn-helix transcriptional regulator n=1 Tax=Streptomyces agglomeratus TaxID=285458 RepID=UPI0008541A4A|nr:MarR family transcriptional regulator [Streptomyces agglomeratus]OEJ40560.1 hypothetical protein BGK70_22645 [Streptomyces agglomeratus]OEJ45060.1 hypothetical protein AR457_14005 [Streptomyces agglomeratus]
MAEAANGTATLAGLDLYRQLAILVGQASGTLEKRMLRRHGVTPLEYMALSELADAGDDSLRMNDLAEAVGVNPSTVSRLMGRLEGGELARREICEADRRATYARITDQGQRVVREAAATFDDDFASVLDAAAVDSRTAALVSLLRQG